MLLTWTDDASDPQHEISATPERRLEAATDARGRAIEVMRIPSPGPVTITERGGRAASTRVAGTKPRRAGDRLAASYVNFYLATTRVVVPAAGPRTRRGGRRGAARVLPRARVIGVEAREILLGGGNIHCITQQVPAVV